MTTLAEVKLWGRTIGAVSLEEDSTTARFQYDPSFAQSGMQIAPLVMPLGQQIYAFPALPQGTFHGLPGLLADSLPDRFGNALIDAWLARQGRSPTSFNAVERLCYTGGRGMGALEFEPSEGPGPRGSEPLDIAALVALASDVLTHRADLAVRLGVGDEAGALQEILQVGTSAGGARAKAVIAWNPDTGEVRSGQLKLPSGFEHWLLKFDGILSNRDKELTDPVGYGAIEYAYHLMATEAGVTMSECRLLEEHGRRHFLTRRFDRPAGRKLHMQSLCAIAYYDFNAAGAHSYEQALQVARSLHLSMDSLEQLFRRMVFNIVARNQDDHVKNIAFLMDKRGRWMLSPAFDVVYSYNPAGAWTSQHQMSVQGKRHGFTMEDLRLCAKTASLKRGRFSQIHEEVRSAVARWSEFAEQAGVDGKSVGAIAGGLRLGLPRR